MSFRTMAAARQKEIKLSMAVVATRTLGIGRTPLGGDVSTGSGVMWLREVKPSNRVSQWGGPVFSDTWAHTWARKWPETKAGFGADPESHQTTEVSSLTFSNCPHCTSRSTQKSLLCPKLSKRLRRSFQFF